MFKAKGRITYDPKRSFKNRQHNWLTIELIKFEETAAYMRWLIDRYWWEADVSPLKRDYCRPPHYPHVSIIRGENLRANKSDWGKHHSGKIVEIEYSNMIRRTPNNKHWFVDAHSPVVPLMRKHYGLDWQRNGVAFKGHITVARVHD